MDTIDIEVAVIGGGVIGLAAAQAISAAGHSVCVLEREPRPGMATSTHNSQVIHAGLYYPSGSLKGRHCIEGTPLLYAFCDQHRVPVMRLGKLVVAYSDADAGRLAEIHTRATANGASGLIMVDAAFVRSREPHVRPPVAAMYSPGTGILEAEALVRTLARLCTDQDVALLTGTPLTACEHSEGALTLITPSERIRAKAVINAAGLYADEVSAMAGGEAFTIYPCRGEYAELIPSRRGMVTGLVYPLPHTHGLGVHITKTVAGSVTFGPTAAYQERKDDYEGNRIPIEDFLEPARELLPAVTLGDLRPGGTGIRPKLHPPAESYADFLIRRDARVPRLIHAAGIESPGLTGCLSIARDLAALVAETL